MKGKLEVQWIYFYCNWKMTFYYSISYFQNVVQYKFLLCPEIFVLIPLPKPHAITKLATKLFIHETWKANRYYGTWATLELEVNKFLKKCFKNIHWNEIILFSHPPPPLAQYQPPKSAENSVECGHSGSPCTVLINCSNKCSSVLMS